MKIILNSDKKEKTINALVNLITPAEHAGRPFWTLQSLCWT